MIPLIDALSILRDLRLWGWRDFKIEMACGFSSGYVCHIMDGSIKLLAHERATRLYNFWESEAVRRGVQIPEYGSPACGPVSQNRLDSVTS